MSGLYNYKALKWDKSPAKAAGFRQPGSNSLSDTIDDLDVLNNLKNGSSIEESGVDEGLLQELDSLYADGIRAIYSLVINHDCTRDPQLIKHIWEHRFEGTQYITEIAGVNIGIKNLGAPTPEQLEVITNDAIEKLASEINILFHCSSGIGRTGTLLCALYMKAHNIYDSEQAIDYIRQHYLAKAVESQVQKDSLQAFGLRLKSEQSSNHGNVLATPATSANSSVIDSASVTTAAQLVGTSATVVNNASETLLSGLTPKAFKEPLK